MIKIGERAPQHSLLEQKNWPQDLHPIAKTHFIVVRRRRDNFPLSFICLADVVGEAEKHAFLVTDER